MRARHCFGIKDDLLAALAIEAIEQWDADIEQQFAGVESGLPALRVIVEATMSMSADGRHDIAGVSVNAWASLGRW